MKKPKKQIPKFDSLTIAIKYHLGIWLKRFYYVTAIVVIVILLGLIGILNDQALTKATMIVSVLIYILAIPISIFLHLENFFKNTIVDSLYYPLLIGLIFVLVNFIFLACFLASWRLMKQRLQEIKEEKTKGLN